MLEKINEELKRRLRDWTLANAGESLTQNMNAIAPAENEYGVDPFGFSLEYALAAAAPFLWLYRHYFRVEAFGLENLPPGAVLLVANHSGQLPLDGAMIGIACLTQAHPPRVVRSMVEKWMASLPYVSTFMSRAGQIVGTPENCRRLLAAKEVILVFPEGTRGLNKLRSQKYQLQEFGLGFMRLALETQTPIVPVAVVGAEEQSEAIANVKPLAKMLGFPAFPLTLTGLPLPLPTRYRIYFGKPMQLSGRPDDEGSVMAAKVAEVRTAIERLLEQGLKERPHVFW